MTGADKTGGKDKPSRRLKFLPFQASTTSLFCRQKRNESEDSEGEFSFGVITLQWQGICLFFLNIHFLFFLWRGEAEEAAQQEKETAAAHDSADEEAEDQTADQREDAANQSYRYRSVRCFTAA